MCIIFNVNDSILIRHKEKEPRPIMTLTPPK